MSNPLFPNFDRYQRELQEEAMREWQRTDMGQIIGGLSKLRGGRMSASQAAGVRNLMRSLKSGGVARYGRLSNMVRDAIAREMSRMFGPLGGVIEALLRPSGQALTDDFNRELSAAAKLLEAFGYTVTPPSTEPPQHQQPRTGSDGSRERAPVRPVAPREDVGTVSVGGRRYRFRPDDPILTGDMIDVTSSNVHSIGYIWNDADPMRGTIKVRFLGKRDPGSKRRTGRGPLYYYYGVHPDVFLAFQKAASKGRFVWDRFRVRGTVSGHQFQYDLAGLGPDKYVPRKATRLGPNEYFLRREVQTKSGNTRVSALGDEFVQRVGGGRRPPGHIAGRGAPNRGSPNRGTPNRGAPNRGAP